MAQREANQSNDAEPKRRRLSKGVWIRLAIYLPLLGFFGWQAAQKALDERKAADEAFRASVVQWLEHPPRTIMLPNGETMPVLEITESEAAALGLIPEGAKRPDDEMSAPPSTSPPPPTTSAPPAAPEAAPAGAAPSSGDTAGTTTAPKSE